jgi:hypothetical protein
MVSGCGSRPALERAGVAVTVPEGWQPTAPRAYTVPGTALAAWTGPEGASLVVYRTLPNPEGTAEALRVDTANRLGNLPEAKLIAQKVRKIGGRDACQVELVLPGMGDAIAASGLGAPLAPKGRSLVPTRRVSVGFPRSSDTLWLAFHYPESAQPRVAPDVNRILDSLRVQSVSQATFSY